MPDEKEALKLQWIKVVPELVKKKERWFWGKKSGDGKKKKKIAV